MTPTITLPRWQEVSLPMLPTLDRDLSVDVVIVGGGLTGLTTAYLLHKEGVRVALVERGRMAAADTGHTTAHLTYVTDYRLHELAHQFGKDAAHQFWRAGATAIDQIEDIVAKLGFQCEFRRVPGFLHTSNRNNDSAEQQQEIERFHKDMQLAREFGFDATFVDAVDVVQRPGLRFANQAKFHPRKYLSALMRLLMADNVPLFELTEFEQVENKPLTVHANGHRLRCDYLVIATHNPLMGLQGALQATLFQTKLSLYTSYVLGAEVAGRALPEALFWDTHDPYDYLRVDSYPDHQYLIFGGEDVKTGQEKDVASAFTRLAQRLQALVPQASITHRWLGQVVETDDGLPFIGENMPGEFIATGFCGNGFTFGTLAAMMARDKFLGRTNEWSDLLRVNRKPFHGGIWRFVTENADFPVHLVGDRLRRNDSTIEDVHAGEGKIITYNGEKVAAYRSDAGDLTLCSPVCTHLKCLVRWNDVASTWDCPCHGSRFHADGTVHSGPAEHALERIDPPFSERKTQPPISRKPAERPM